ncbi:hypothetical protein V5799_003653, partial [Amblyomma americanum]
MMAADEFKGLRVLLQTFEPEDLQLLDDENLEWLPRLRSIQPSKVVKCILKALKAFDKVAHRLQGIAWIRCWLMPFDEQRNWVFYSVTEKPTLQGCNEALTRMTTALKRLNDDASEVPHAWIVRGSAVYACLLVEWRKDQSVERYAVYVSMWTVQPLFAVTCSTKISRRIQEVLQFAFGSVNLLFKEIRGNPEVALNRALSTLSTLSKFSAEVQGQRYPIADQQPWESLAVGSQGEQLSSVPGAT